MKRTELSIPLARRVALAAQGFADRPPSGAVTARHLLRMYERIKVLQIDSVNVLSRAHYLPAFARLGCYDQALLDTLATPRRRVFEYWAHMASFSPIEQYPLMRWRMLHQRAFADRRFEQLRAAKESIATDALRFIADRGEVTASQFAPARPGKQRAQMWGWHDGKVVLEHLFISGQIACVRRNSQFERVFDIPERVIPHAILAQPTPSGPDAQRSLIELAAAAHGIATERHLKDYFRLRGRKISSYIRDLIDQGILTEVTIRGLDGQWYLHRDARFVRRVAARALLSPFDSLIWERQRTEVLWDLRYRIEIYTPKAKRVHGYYVLPFLLDEQLVARVDLKADRYGSALLVQSAHLEPGRRVDPRYVAAQLDEQLKQMAQWLGLSSVEVRQSGDLAPLLGN